MSTLSTTNESNSANTVSSDILVPVDTDKEPIVCEDNDAYILGTLHEVGRYYARVGLFQPHFAHRAVVLSNGKMAIDSVSAVSFTTGVFADPRSFDDPCPPTVQRLADYNARLTAAGRPAVTPAATIPAALADTYVINKWKVDQEDATLMRSLGHVFSGLDGYEDLTDAASGSGTELIRLLRARGNAASPEDRAAVSATHTEIVRNGVTGETTSDTFKVFYDKYKKATRHLPPGERPPPASEVQMINLVALKADTTVALQYQVKAAATPPTKLAAKKSPPAGERYLCAARARRPRRHAGLRHTARAARPRMQRTHRERHFPTLAARAAPRHARPHLHFFMTQAMSTNSQHPKP